MLTEKSSFSIYTFRCKARVRTKANGKQLEIVEREHNHNILKKRRKKGTLKAFYEQRKRDADEAAAKKSKPNTDR